MIKNVGMVALLVAATLLVSEARVEAGPQNLPVVTPERAYLCFDGSSASDVMTKANEAGARGWRLVTAAPGPHGSVWCFEQLGATRPLEKTH